MTEPHTDAHDPTVDHVRCLVCAEALSAAFAQLADLDLGPKDAGRLISELRRLAEQAVAHGAAA